MSIEKDFILSFYKEIAVLNQDHQVMLVQHIETGRLYVKKTLALSCLSICRILQKEKFPHIPAVIELIEDESTDTLILIEEYIHGRTLEQVLEERTFTELETVQLIKSLCQILQPLHRHDPKIIHRDIKPSNLMLDQSNTLYLLDFDASKEYHPQKDRDTVLMGTAEYAAPEQYGFFQSDERTDIYSIGVLMNKLLTGCLPAEQKYDGPLRSIICACTAIDPADRFADCQLLENVLTKTENLLNEKQKPDRVPSDEAMSQPGIPRSKPKSLRRYILTAAGCVVAAWFLFTTDFTAEDGSPMTGYNLWVNRIGASCSAILMILYYTDTFCLRSRLPWTKSQKLFPEIIRLTVGGMICLMLPIVFTVLLER